MVPYTGTISAEVQNLEPGFARVQLREHKKVLNHLSSIHAVALMNLGELATGLACLSSLPPKGRSILKKLEITYLKKARGTLTAEARTPMVSQLGEKADALLNAEIRDEKNDLVAEVKATWQVGMPSQ